MNAAVIERLKAAVGPKGWSEDPEVLAPRLAEPRNLYRGATPLLVMPGSTAEVSAVVAICAETGTPIVPQGGNTGLVGGQTPQGEILLSTARLNRIRALDPVNNTITAEAGCILADVQRVAADADRLFPLSLAAEGSCTIGGNLSTNAGGTAVLRYGNARALALGLEVVLPDGRILDMLRGLRKDNTGYDLKQLFIGAEGTLGIITAAVLTLFPRPRASETAFIALPSLEAALSLLNEMRGRAGDMVTAFEIMPRIGLELVARHIPGTRDPFAETHPWYALIELSSGGEGETLRTLFEAVLADCMEHALASDAVIATGLAQAKDFWRLREALSEAQKFAGGSIKCDVSVPVSAIPEFVAQAQSAVLAICPGARPVPFGHAGDGNIHFNISQPEGMETAAFLGMWDRIAGAVHNEIARLGGSISAEHGLGVMKREQIKNYKSTAEIALMRTVKDALDPKGIMNPGRIV